MTTEERLERIEHAILDLAVWAADQPAHILAGRENIYLSIADTLGLDEVGYAKHCRKQRGEV